MWPLEEGDGGAVAVVGPNGRRRVASAEALAGAATCRVHGYQFKTCVADFA